MKPFFIWKYLFWKSFGIFIFYFYDISINIYIYLIWKTFIFCKYYFETVLVFFKFIIFNEKNDWKCLYFGNLYYFEKVVYFYNEFLWFFNEKKCYLIEKLYNLEIYYFEKFVYFYNFFLWFSMKKKTSILLKIFIIMKSILFRE